jgi:hypothetical protein
MSLYLLGGFTLGLLLVAAYISVALRRDERADLTMAVILILSALSVATGLKVIVLCITADTVEPFGEEDRIYIALGGIALLWVSFMSIAAAFDAEGD